MGFPHNRTVNVPCPTHSGRRAHKSCHDCRKPICRLCEVAMRGHLYCSTRCARDAGRHAVWRVVRTQLVRRIPARLAVAAVVLAAFAPVILALRTVRELDALSAPSPIAPPRRAAPSARLESIREAPSGAVLEGTASEGCAVFLFAAGRFVTSVPAANGRFRFEHVRETGPYRVGAMSLSAEAALPEEAPEAPPPQIVPPPRPAPTPRPRIAAAPPPPPPPPLRPGPLRPTAPDMTRGPSDRREVLVSFDAGSSDRGAAEILDALAKRSIRTTMFVTGEFVRRYPAAARRIAADGHEVGNHTDTHPHLTTYARDGRQITRPGVDRAFVAGELARTARLYRDATGKAMAPLWRAPFGEHNAEIRRWAAEQGYWHVGWTGGRTGLDGLDWITDPRARGYQPAERLLSRLVQHAENGGIVLLHLGSDRTEPVASRIDVLLDGLAGRGFQLARASEFLERQGYDAARLASFRSEPVAGAP
jgi:peptidoglycan/xylan/chitin deacetylase (PgdA/CDA1 family)